VQRALSIAFSGRDSSTLKPRKVSRANSSIKKRVMLANYFTDELEKTRSLPIVDENESYMPTQTH